VLRLECDHRNRIKPFSLIFILDRTYISGDNIDNPRACGPGSLFFDGRPIMAKKTAKKKAPAKKQAKKK